MPIFNTIKCTSDSSGNRYAYIDGLKGGKLLWGLTATESAAYQVDGKGFPLLGSRTNALEVNADSGSTDLNGDYYVSAIKGNFILGTTSSNASIIGVLGKLNANTTNFGSGDHYAVRGHVDFWGNSTLAGANNNTGGVSAYIENEATTTISAGNVLCGVQAYQVGSPTIAAGVFPAGGINPAIWIRANALASAWQTGIYMPVNSVETGIRIGNWVGSGATGSAIAFAAVQNVYSDGQLDLVAVFGESSSDLTGAYSAKCARFRHLVSGSSITPDQETYGSVSQLCAKGSTLTHMHAGLMGTFEGTGASVVLNSSRFSTGSHAAVLARIGGNANITCTTPLYGFLAFNNATAAIGSGTLAAYGTSVQSTSYQWPVGLYIPSGSCTLPIDVNSSVMGAAGRIAKLYGSCAAGNMGDGYGAVEIDLTLSGTLAGMVAASSTWVNVTGASVTAGGNRVMTRSDGIYVTATGTPMASATAIIGGRFSYVVAGGGNPGALYLFETNISDNKTTALFACNAAVDYTWVTGAKSGTAGNIPLFRDQSAGVTWYVNVYSS